ncbi:TonB-dependent receptor family protein [Cognaticolwellia beringensis]|uniref:TonB-dependent receptor n=1 Tax=Cognaticolwellia beringensis TaxID=1967665 RepID=A0A222GDK1_9GAMM|nr:TonB-dependent receptor [Cognaticolwellia beringensis]ASP49958.1 TonB-dependent receptor [Cognaticolwellia beringensis]
MRISSLFQPALIALSVVSALSNTATADDDMEHLAIFGNAQAINDVPGSAHMISQAELEKFDFTDIMRTLTSVPGVYVLEEDGYGLRPNIGMRGTGQNRSEKVTIMEDGVLAAPAPYSAPSAYYFPTAGRMQQIEVLKGTSSAMYGPRTTGGVVNMLSRTIPNEALAGQVNLSAGEDGFAKAHAYVGGAGKNVSSVVEVFRYQADGFKSVNHTGDDTGFVKNDIMAKVMINSDADAKHYQELEFKLKYSDENSDETYMGLTEADFEASPYSRYSASQLDNMDTKHKQLQINHHIKLSERFTLGTSAYYNEFSRNWFKTSSVNGNGLSDGAIDDAAAFDNGTFGNDEISVDVKANSRAYESQGIQTVLDADFGAHQVKFGARYHEDEMDRFQWVNKYSLDNTNYEMTLTEAGIHGADSNRIDSAEAIALFVHDEYTIGDFIINAGLRYEDMTISRKDWDKGVIDRNAPLKKDVSNNIEVLLPSLAVTYRVNNDLIIIGGVQKGFAPPAPGNDKTENEESINYELGLRYNKQAFSGEALFFYSDYENMHGNCTASQGCDDENIGNQYNAGEVKVSGLEVKTGYEFAAGALTIPVDLTYTFTTTEFQNSFQSGLDTWGNVTVGDELPYVPENQLQLSVGVVGEQWRSDILVRYVDEMRTTAGQGAVFASEAIASHTVVDMAAHYNIADNQEITFSVDNLLDKEYMATRAHGSIMAGKPRSVTLGYKYSF